MSIFYETLPPGVAGSFKKRKKKFKKGKPCAVCGHIYPPEAMMVAHKIPVTDLTTYDALHDASNWEVRCIYCERRYNQKHDKERSK